jgi:hypothetical protein
MDGTFASPGDLAGWTGGNLGPFGINDLTCATFANARGRGQGRRGGR